MITHRSARSCLSLGAVAIVVALTGCVMGPNRAVESPQPLVVSQPNPVYLTQPYVIQRNPVVVYQPVYSPVRVSVPQRYYYTPVTYTYVCSPGAMQPCQAYCGRGVQYCNADGSGWGTCVEQSYY